MSPSRGEIWLINLDPTVGDEIRKVRPAVVVNRDALGVLALRVIVPVTAWQERFEGCDWLVQIEPSADSGLEKASAADTFQVRSISARRFVRRLGSVSDTDISRINEALKLVLSLV